MISKAPDSSRLSRRPTWLAEIRSRLRPRHPWAIVGFVHSLLSTLFACGALLHALILHTGLDRRQIVGTMAACLTGMSVFAVTGYALNGFDYLPFLELIVFAIIAAFVDTRLGRLAIDRVSEALFRTVFKVPVKMTTLRLMYVGLIAST